MKRLLVVVAIVAVLTVAAFRATRITANKPDPVAIENAPRVVPLKNFELPTLPPIPAREKTKVVPREVR